MTTSEIYKQAERIAGLPRRVRSMHAQRHVFSKSPHLNPYDFWDIVQLYKNAKGKL